MLNSKYRIFLMLSLLFCLICGRGQTTTGQTDVFTSDGAWCWFSDPRAIYYEGTHQRTYAGWITSDGDVTVGFYDHQTDDIKTYVLHTALEVDDHDNPSLLITPEGKLMVFYSKHSKAYPIQLAVAEAPERIDTWEPTRSLYINDTVAYSGKRDSYTYTNSYMLTGEKNQIHLFWRGMDFKPNYSYSKDGGSTWETGKIFIQPENIYRNRRPYLKVSSNGKNRLHFAFTDGHPRNEPTNSIYYACYEDGNLVKANGEKICKMSEIPLGPEEADMVYDATITEEKSWIWDVAEGQDGLPVIVYVRYPIDSQHVYYYARWDGNTWNNYRLVDSGTWFPQTPENEEEREKNYSGGIVLDHEDPNIVYLSREVNGVFEIEKWMTADGGKTWRSTPVTSNSEYDQVRPFAIRNMPQGQGPQLLWLSNKRYIHYTDYDSSIKMDRSW